MWPYAVLGQLSPDLVKQADKFQDGYGPYAFGVVAMGLILVLLFFLFIRPLQTIVTNLIAKRDTEFTELKTAIADIGKKQADTVVVLERVGVTVSHAATSLAQATQSMERSSAVNERVVQEIDRVVDKLDQKGVT